jgi:hypothetical protein
MCLTRIHMLRNSPHELGPRRWCRACRENCDYNGGKRRLRPQQATCYQGQRYCSLLQRHAHFSYPIYVSHGSSSLGNGKISMSPARALLNPSQSPSHLLQQRTLASMKLTAFANHFLYIGHIYRWNHSVAFCLHPQNALQVDADRLEEVSSSLDYRTSRSTHQQGEQSKEAQACM